MPIINSTLTFFRRQPRWRQLTFIAVLIIGGVWWWRRADSGAGTAPTFAARRGPLEITVLEGGSLSALESQEIKCEVRVGYQGTKILRIVEEGYFVTEDDVRTNKVLCELDSSELQKQIAQQEIQYQSALASLTDAEQNYEIQLGQNESDLKTAEQKTRFARMDFDKFLGDTVTEQIVKQLGLDALLAAAATNDVALTTHAAAATPARGVGAAIPGTEMVPGPAGDPPPAATTPPPARILIDFSQFATVEALGDGEAKQKLRKFEDDLQVAQKELSQARTALEGTKRLFEKGFVPRTEMVRDEISYESNRLKVQTAETARALYLKYEFPKAAEESLSKFTEAVREQDKARRVAISKLAQARARLNSARGQHEVQLRQRNDLNEQLSKCSIVAKKSGLVVYGGGRDQEFYYGGEERIREGATVRERQAIITIPDMSRMAVNVKIHESYIKKVKRGLKARITVDAFPDEVLTGEVIKVGVLPDSQNRWMNPDLKVYLTTIAIDGAREWVKPGMSAKVEILVNHLADVIHIPVQSVFPDNGKQVCYVARGFKPERREVEVGEFTDEFIEIKSGLREGERVLLRPPVELEHRPGGKPAPASPAPEPGPEPATPA